MTSQAPPISTSFGEWVQCTRLDRGLTKAECARRAGVSLQRWSEIETKRPRRTNHGSAGVQLGTAVQVARALDVPEREALVAAGHAEAERTVNTSAANTTSEPSIVHYFNELPRDVQQDVLEIVRALYKRHGNVPVRRDVSPIYLVAHQ